MSIQLLGFPQDNNSSFMQGPAEAPDVIRAALHSESANLFAESGCNLGDKSFWSDAGNVELAGQSGSDAFTLIHTAVAKQISAEHLVLGLGGDHSVSYPAIMAHAQAYDGLNVLHFDAHPDTYDDFQGNPYSHASPFARLMETGKISRLVQVGIRTQTAHQADQAERFNIETFLMRDHSEVPALDFSGPVYLSLDLDALDPAYAPGVSHHEPGGLSTREVLRVIQNFSGKLVGADIVELNPRRDVNSMTAMVAAKFVREIVSRLHADSTR